MGFCRRFAKRDFWIKFLGKRLLGAVRILSLSALASACVGLRRGRWWPWGTPLPSTYKGVTKRVTLVTNVKINVKKFAGVLHEKGVF